MVKINRSFSVDAADLGPYVGRIITAIPDVLAGLRGLQFDDGVVLHPVSGARHEGLRDVTRAHPRPGCRYELVMVGESLDPNGPWAAELSAVQAAPAEQRFALHNEVFERHRDSAMAAGLLRVELIEAEIELLHDDAGQFAVRVIGESWPFAADVRLTRPTRPDELTVEAVVPITERFVAGDLVTEAVVTLGSLPGGALVRPQVRVDVRHRRGRVRVVAKVTDAPGGRWTVDVKVAARGSGWIRPLASVALFIARRKLLATFDEKFPAALERFESELSEAIVATPLPPADDIVADIVAGFAKDLDQARRLADHTAVVVSTFTLRAAPPARCPKRAWRSSAPDLDVDGHAVNVDWYGDQLVEIPASGAWIATKDWNGYGALGRTSVRVLVRPGDIVEYQERWWSFATPHLRVVGRSAAPVGSHAANPQASISMSDGSGEHG